MTHLIQLDSNGKLVISPETLALVPFKNIYNKDKTRNKETAFNDILGVYLMEGFLSPYHNYPDTIKEESILKDNKLDKDFYKRDDIKEACEFYKEQQKNSLPTLRALNACDKGIERLCKELENPKSKIKDVIESISKIRNVIKDYNAIREEVLEETTGNSKRRGGSKTNMYENPED